MLHLAVVGCVGGSSAPGATSQAIWRDCFGGLGFAPWVRSAGCGGQEPQQEVATIPSPIAVSNDEPAHVASAQRLLYSLGRGIRPDPADLRPHELFNHFTFEGDPPAPGQTFAVLGGALRDGESVWLSFSVHAASPAPKPLDLTVVLGAGSDAGMATSVVDGLVKNLAPGDRLDLVAVDPVCVPVQRFTIGEDDEARLADVARVLPTKDNGDLGAAVRTALSLVASVDPAETHGRQRAVAVVSGLSSPHFDVAVLDRVDAALAQGVRTSAVGLGETSDDGPLRALADRGRGAHGFAGSASVQERVVASLPSLVMPVADDVRITVTLPPSLVHRTFHGEEASTDPDDIDGVAVHSGGSQALLYETRATLSLQGADTVTVRIDFRHAATGEPDTETFRFAVGALLDASPANAEKARLLLRFAEWSAKVGAAEGDACLEPAQAVVSAVPSRSDPEIAYLAGLVHRWCPNVRAGPRVAVKIRLASVASDTFVTLACQQERFAGSVGPTDPIVRFDAVPSGNCMLTAGAQTAAVAVPNHDATLDCSPSSGGLACR